VQQPFETNLAKKQKGMDLTIDAMDRLVDTKSQT
jgi:hypothetical protein